MTLHKIIFLVLVVFLVVSCTPISNDGKEDRNREIDEQSETIDTPTPCPIATPFLVKNIEGYNTQKVVYILVDKSGSYNHLTQLALDRIFETLPTALNPGDYVYIGWIGVDVTNPDSLFFQREITDLDVPGSILEPISQSIVVNDPVIENIPTISSRMETQPVNDLSTFGKISATKTALAIQTQLSQTQTAISIQNTENSIATQQAIHDELCENFSANEQKRKDFATFQQNRHKILKDFIDVDVKNAINKATNIPHDDHQTFIYESLYIASRILQDKRQSGNYSHLELIIFSDMQETGSRPSGLNFNFDGVDVTLAMVYCEKAVFCQDVENEWPPFFHKNNSNDVSIKLVQESSPDALTQLLTTINK